MIIHLQRFIYSIPSSFPSSLVHVIDKSASSPVILFVTTATTATTTTTPPSSSAATTTSFQACWSVKIEQKETKKTIRWKAVSTKKCQEIDCIIQSTEWPYRLVYWLISKRVICKELLEGVVKNRLKVVSDDTEESKIIDDDDDDDEPKGEWVCWSSNESLRRMICV